MLSRSLVEHSTSSAGTMPRSPLTFAEYFAGIGLFRMGLESVGWRCVYANDWSSERAQMYEGFFGERYEVKDIFSVDCEDIPPTTMATCSFPCIDLSLAGKGKGMSGKHSGAFWGFHDRLREQGLESPRVVVLENVAGWLYSNDGKDFYWTVRSLNEIGYTCDVFMLNARSFVPQSRPRLFMIGIKDTTPTGNFDRLTFRSKRLMPARLKKLMLDNDDLRWASLNVPEPPPYRNDGFSADIVERLDPKDPRWWPDRTVEKHLAMMSHPHLSMVKNIALGEKERFRTFFRRRRRDGQRAEVRSDDIAGCLRTAVGGSGKQFLVAAGNNTIRMRALTAREYARLQGVPDSLPIVADTERQSLNAFGDAVCVPVVSWLAKEVLHSLMQEETRT